MDAVTDRTQADIDNRTEKAFLNASDLNRIEGNCSILAGILAVSGLTIKTNWTYSDSITPSQITRILENIAALRAAYFTYTTTPKTPDGILQWEKLNAAEQILFDLYSLHTDNVNAAYYAGERYSGETTGVL